MYEMVHHFFFPTEFLPSYILKGSTICVFLLKFTHFHMEYIWKFHTLGLYSGGVLLMDTYYTHRVLQGSPWGIFQAPAAVAVISRGCAYGCGIPVPTGEGFHMGFWLQGIPRGDVFMHTITIKKLLLYSTT
jgi:hypothetical protein